MTEYEIVQALIKLMKESNTTRLEIVRPHVTSEQWGGYCVHGDRTTFHVAVVLRKQ